MVRELAAIAERVEANPLENSYASRDRLRALHQMADTVEPADRLRYELELGIHELYAGDTQAAISRLRALDEQLSMRGNPPTSSQRTSLARLLAVAYLRLGEQANCVTQHRVASCLLPIAEDGVHLDERGSRAAIEAYETLLEMYPDDLGARWLLNLAYMTVGEHPEGVPERWRIDAGVFASEAEVGRFRDVAAERGVGVLGLSGGAVMDDLDNDGDLDIVASSWGLRDQLRYFRNDGPDGFVERTAAAGLTGQLGGLNILQADYNNDGWIDLLVLRGAWLMEAGRHPNSLLRNNGDGTFTDVTREAGLLARHPTQTAAWADVDGDGDLDLFVGNESFGQPDFPAHPSALYRNNGDGTFTDIAEQTLGLMLVGVVKGVAWGDYDNDGDPDLYLSRLGQRNSLYRNDGADGEGRWQFTDVAEAAGVGGPSYSFPTWFWDYDNDGWLDIFVADYDYGVLDNADPQADARTAVVAADYLGQRAPDAPRPSLYHNNGDGTFTDVAPELGLDHTLFAMGSNFGDLDNDGWLDMYIGTGAPDYRALFPNRLFRNDRGRAFQDVTTAAGVGHIQKGHGVAWGDYDADGDQDIYAVMGGAYSGDVYQNALFENPGHGNHWLALRLEGREANRFGVGARVRVTIDTPDGPRDINRTVGSGGSFGASPLRQEIGLGDATAIRAVEIRWPGSGTIQMLTGLELDRAYHVREGEDAPQPLAIDGSSG